MQLPLFWWNFVGFCYKVEMFSRMKCRCCCKRDCFCFFFAVCLLLFMRNLALLSKSVVVFFWFLLWFFLQLFKFNPQLRGNWRRYKPVFFSGSLLLFWFFQRGVDTIYVVCSILEVVLVFFFSGVLNFKFLCFVFFFAASNIYLLKNY